MRHGICAIVTNNGERYIGQYFNNEEYELVPQDDDEAQENKLLKELKTKGLYADSAFYITNQIPELNEDFLPYSMGSGKKNLYSNSYATLSKKNNIKSHYNELNYLYNFINTGGEYNKVVSVRENITPSLTKNYFEDDSVKEYILDDGSKFVGVIIEGLFQGYGQITLVSGDVYNGEFSDGFFNGEGELSLATGDTCVGMFVNGLLDGKGKYIFRNGAR